MKEKIIALFMVCMIIALPIYSASVFAGINNVGIFGNDYLEGYRKENDLTYVEANVSISGDEDITSEQISFNDINFNDCKAYEDYFKCVLGINRNVLEPKKHSFTIKLKDDSEDIVDTYVSTFIVDGKAPTIESFSINPKITKKGEITAKYSVKDYAYDSRAGSGLSKILICKNSITNVIKKITINDYSYTDSRELKFETSDFISGTGSTNVCIAAYDKLDQLSEVRCEKLSVDETDPKIKEDSFKITDSSGNEINSLSGKQMNVILSIEVEDDSLDKVTADLSGLNNDILGYKNKEANCVKQNGVSLCTWSGITIKIDTPGKIDIKINATDTVGNSAEESVSISVDETDPKINKDSFKITDYSGNEIKYLSGKQMNVIISIQSHYAHGLV